MAPEQPNTLVILDLQDPSADEGGDVYHWNPVDATNQLVVLWEAARCPADFIDTAESVVYVAVPPGYKQYRYPRAPSPEPLVQSWRGQVGSALMLVAILPPGYAFDEPCEGSEWPTKAKVVGERMAVYWFIVSSYTTVEPAWKIAPIDDPAQLIECCAAINRRPSLALPPEEPVPPAAERREWAEQRAEPVAGPPPMDLPLDRGG